MPVEGRLVENCSSPASFFPAQGKIKKMGILAEVSPGFLPEFPTGIPQGVQTRISQRAPPIIHLARRSSSRNSSRRAIESSTKNSSRLDAPLGTSEGVPHGFFPVVPPSIPLEN